MATQRQFAANRESSKKSTGPRSPNGKRVSSQNARKTGAYSTKTVLPEEDAAEFARLRAEYYGEWSPSGPTERCMVERLVFLAWRMARCCRAESGIIDALRQLPKGVGGIPAAYLRDARAGDSLGRIVGMEASTFKTYTATIAALEALQQTRSKRNMPVAREPKVATG